MTISDSRRRVSVGVNIHALIVRGHSRSGFLSALLRVGLKSHALSLSHARALDNTTRFVRRHVR